MLRYHINNIQMAHIPVRELRSHEHELELSQSFSIRDVADLLEGKDMVQELHRHNFFFVLALEKGKGRHEIDFTPYKVDDQSIFVMRPGQVHQLTLKTGSTGYLMAFDMTFYHRKDVEMKQVLRNATNSNFCKVEKKPFGKLNSILTYIFHEYHDKKDRYQDVIKANLDIFFIEFLRQSQHRQNLSGKSIPYEMERLEKFQEHIETHVATNKQVSAYADMLNLSVYQLNAITKKLLGKTPSEIINEFIILESKRYLLATADRVNQIAYRLGYEDPSYFIRFFKKHTGYSPEAFRANLR